jgi:hypothetical protein
MVPFFPLGYQELFLGRKTVVSTNHTFSSSELIRSGEVETGACARSVLRRCGGWWSLGVVGVHLNGGGDASRSGRRRVEQTKVGVAIGHGWPPGRPRSFGSSLLLPTPSRGSPMALCR